ncbi:MAG: hypothetical protein KKA79_03875 [Nanoarchaeota archaeon]|nr:hypothetical protein [Nanoarchaeota archaeon]
MAKQKILQLLILAAIAGMFVGAGTLTILIEKLELIATSSTGIGFLIVGIILFLVVRNMK